MIVTVVCCFSVVCTAVLATYGISSKPPQHECLAFSLAFASLSILISAVYYLIIKVSWLAIGAVLMQHDTSMSDPPARRKRSTIMRQLILVDRSKFKKIAASEEDADFSFQQQSNTSIAGKVDDDDDAKSLSPWSFSSTSDCSPCSKGSPRERCEIPVAENELGETDSVEFQQPSTVTERYSTLKVWTNVYGLAVGTFCIVHSLLLASELGSSVFCFCLWLESLRECRCKCSLFKKLASRKAYANQRQSSDVFMPCLSILLLLGIVFKSMGSLLSASAEAHEQDALSVVCSILLPVAGVLCVRNMRKTSDIRNTMELSAPVCWLGSIICLLCIVVGTAGGSCIVNHVYTSGSENDNDWNLESNMTLSSHLQAADVWIPERSRRAADAYSSNIRFQPILSVLVIPFPLVCSVIAVVSCSQSSHIMVSFLLIC